MALFSIGHSNVTAERLLALLQQHAVTTLADVRSQPYSRYNPQFCREALQQFLTEHGLRYVFLGAPLGGKPAAAQFRQADGNVDYAALAVTDFFQQGLAKLRALGAATNVAFMCAEADYQHCHRYWLITRALVQQGEQVQHILASGALVPTAAEAFEARQPSLF